jgi:hypothetical protein
MVWKGKGWPSWSQMATAFRRMWSFSVAASSSFSRVLGRTIDLGSAAAPLAPASSSVIFGLAGIGASGAVRRS